MYGSIISLRTIKLLSLRRFVCTQAQNCALTDGCNSQLLSRLNDGVGEGNSSSLCTVGGENRKNKPAVFVILLKKKTAWKGQVMSKASFPLQELLHFIQEFEITQHI